MQHPEDALAVDVLHRATRQAQATQVLASLPPVGVRIWELPLAYASGAAAAFLLYVSGQPIAVCIAIAVGIAGASLAVAASAETRRIAKRLAAVETLLSLGKGAA